MPAPQRAAPGRPNVTQSLHCAPIGGLFLPHRRDCLMVVDCAAGVNHRRLWLFVPPPIPVATVDLAPDGYHPEPDPHVQFRRCRIHDRPVLLGDVGVPEFHREILAVRQRRVGQIGIPVSYL